MIDEVCHPVERNAQRRDAAIPAQVEWISQIRAAEGDVAGTGNVDGLRPGEARLHLQAVRQVVVNGRLQGVIAGSAVAVELVEVAEFLVREYIHRSGILVDGVRLVIRLVSDISQAEDGGRIELLLCRDIPALRHAHFEVAGEGLTQLSPWGDWRIARRHIGNRRERGKGTFVSRSRIGGPWIVKAQPTCNRRVRACRASAGTVASIQGEGRAEGSDIGRMIVRRILQRSGEQSVSGMKDGMGQESWLPSHAQARFPVAVGCRHQSAGYSCVSGED